MNHYDVIVIGGGEAGLAVGHYLAEQGQRFAILEAADRPAAAWRARWDSLRLFTPARHGSLPGKPTRTTARAATTSSPTCRTTRVTCPSRQTPLPQRACCRDLFDIHAALYALCRERARRTTA